MGPVLVFGKQEERFKANKMVYFFSLVFQIGTCGERAKKLEPRQKTLLKYKVLRLSCRFGLCNGFHLIGILFPRIVSKSFEIQEPT